MGVAMNNDRIKSRRKFLDEENGSEFFFIMSGVNGNRKKEEIDQLDWLIDIHGLDYYKRVESFLKKSDIYLLFHFE